MLESGANMELNTYPKRPDWLTDEVVKEMKQTLKDCQNPYTQEDIDDLEFDGAIDFKRLHAYDALEILSKYGLLKD